MAFRLTGGAAGVSSAISQPEYDTSLTSIVFAQSQRQMVAAVQRADT